MILRWAFDNLTTLPNCLLGVHDGPKVVMPGNRLVNGAGVSRRQRGQSTVSDLVADTDGRIQKQLSVILRWGFEYNGDCRIGVHG